MLLYFSGFYNVGICLIYPTGSIDAIQILVEEAKVACLLRLLHDLRSAMQEGEDLWEARVNQCITRIFPGGPPPNSLATTREIFELRIRNFEEAAGVLLLRALGHIEACQLLDLPLLLKHIDLVLNSKSAEMRLSVPSVPFNT